MKTPVMFFASLLPVTFIVFPAIAAPSAKKPKATERSATTLTSAQASSDKAPAKDQATSADANASSTANPISIAPLLGMGFNGTKMKENGVETKDEVGAYGAGFGLRAGYTLPMRVYIGGTFVYHLGQKKDSEGIELKASTFYFGPEAGYDISAGPLVVRPYAGMGLASVSVKASAPGFSLDASGTKFALWPGVTALFPIEKFFVGVDGRYVLVTGTEKEVNANAVSLFATGGMRL